MNRNVLQYAVLSFSFLLLLFSIGGEAPALQTPQANASVSVTPRNGFAPLDVQIDVQVSPPSSPACIPDSFTLSFGDATPAISSSSNGQTSFAHTYSQPGSYFVNVNFVRHENVGSAAPDCVRASASASAVVTVLTQSPLQARISATPTTGNAPLTVKFDGSDSVTDPNCPIDTFNWDFGDGSTASGESVSHTYADPALYTATLDITDTCNRVDSETIEIDVNQVQVVFNGVPIFNLPIEPAINPPCDCSEPTYNSAIAQVPGGCNSCQSTGGYAGIGADTGGHTVLLHSGEFTHHVRDLVIPGRGFDWSFERKYRSGLSFDGPLGHNWELNYNRRIIPVLPNNLADVQETFPDAEIGDVIRMDGFARADLFKLEFERSDRSATFIAPEGYYVTLELLSNAGFVERDRNGTLAVYDSLSPGDTVARLTRITDRNGNTMRFEHNRDGQLIRVIDTLGRSIDYFYDQDGHIISVRDFANRIINLSYDDNGDLISVSGPPVTNTPNGNDFPNGKTTRYSYSSGFNDAMLNHNLLTITAPNEVANGGPPYVVVTYDENASSLTADQVLAQQVGGLNGSGIQAGGTIQYEYLGALTRVTDRNGNLAEYEFDTNGHITRRTEMTNRHIRAGEIDRYQTSYQYNNDGEITRIVHPEGNETIYSYDSGNADRHQHGNPLSIRHLADSDRGGDQSLIQTNYTYDPFYNQIRTITDPRGGNLSFTPPNGGANSADRYTTTHYFDYQEGDNISALALEFSITESEVRDLLGDIPMNLGDLNGDGITTQIAGNVVRIEHPSPRLLTNSNQSAVEASTSQPVIERFVYNEAGQMTREIDPEGNATLYEYYPENDPDGDQQSVNNQLSSDPIGYLKARTRDAESGSERNSKTNPEPAAIRSEYFYDAVGNIVGERNGRGVMTEYAVNQLNQIVQITRAADVSDALQNSEEPDWSLCDNSELVECDAGMVPFAYVTNIYYDANDNIILREIESSDTNNLSLAGSFIEQSMRYDILNNLVERTEEISENPEVRATTRYRYDANENRAIEFSPVAVNGTQPSNVMSIEYDERDLPFEVTRGGLSLSFQNNDANADIPDLNNVPLSIDVSTTAYFYDGNGNMVRTLDAVDNSGDGKLDESLAFYDGFDRLVSNVDAVGTQSFMQYDPAGNLIRHSRYGAVGGESPSDNSAATKSQPMSQGSFSQPLLERTAYLYDELNRVIEEQKSLFDYVDEGVNYEREVILSDGPLGTSDDGIVTQRFEYDRNSRLTHVTEDDGDTFVNFYDGVGRVIGHLGPEANEVLTTYDDANNVVRVIESDVTQPSDVTSSDVPSLSGTFTTHYSYDALNRLIRVVDNIGQTTRYRYDSRGNLIESTDAQHSVSEGDLISDPLGLSSAGINLNGNRVEHYYDGLDRHIAEVVELRLEGQGENALDVTNPANNNGKIVNDTAYDANSRVIARADDGSALGDQNTSIGVIEATNPQGNVTRYQYDDLNRLSQTRYDDGTIEGYFYDADDNLIRYIDANGSIHDNVYDGLNRITSHDILRASSSSSHALGGFKDPSIQWELIGTTIQEFEYDGLSRLTRSFDNNDPEDDTDDAVVTRAYDSLGRLLEEVQNGNIVTSRWAGDNNRLELLYAGPREVAYTYDGLDRIDTIGDALTPLIADYDYIGRYRVLERSLVNNTELSYLDPTSRSASGYDAARRVVGLEHRLSDSSELITRFDYTYDRANNKLSQQSEHLSLSEDYAYDSAYRLTDFESGELSQRFVLDGANNWSTFNGIQSLPNNVNEYGAFGGRSQNYDDNGNLIDDGVLGYVYDADNRLREVVDLDSENVIAQYTYDAHGRRISKSVTNSGDLDGDVEYIYDGWQVIEENREDLALVFLYDNGIDEPISMDIDEGHDFEPDGTLFYHQDGKNHVVALTDESGDVVQRISYDAYGVPTFSDDSETSNPYLFSGRRYDPETGLYYYRARMYDPKRGRFLQRDPIGVWSDRLNLGNGYSYVSNNPANLFDPMGKAIDYFLHIEGIDGESGGGGGGGGGSSGGGGGGGGCQCGINCSCNPDPCCGKTCSCGDAMPDPGISIGDLYGLNTCPTTPRAKKIFIGGLSFMGGLNPSADDDVPPGTIVVAPPDQIPPPDPAPDWYVQRELPLDLMIPVGPVSPRAVKQILRDFSGWTSAHGIPAAQQECCGVSCSCQPPPASGGYTEGPIIVEDDDD